MSEEIVHDVLIVGAGLAGSWAALEASKNGVEGCCGSLQDPSAAFSQRCGSRRDCRSVEQCRPVEGTGPRGPLEQIPEGDAPVDSYGYACI